MKPLYLIPLFAGALLLSCSEEISELGNMQDKHKIYVYSELPRGYEHEAEVSRVNKKDDTYPITYFGDVIGYQAYKDGLPHGAYYSATTYKYKRKNHLLPDGRYKNGKKHGYFYRHSNVREPDYISYYIDDELVWADVYNQGWAQPKMPYFLGDKNVKINAKRPDGKKWFKGEFRNGKPYGKHYYYNWGEQVNFEVNWRDSIVYKYSYRADTVYKTTEREFNHEEVASNTERGNRLRLEYAYKYVNGKRR